MTTNNPWHHIPADDYEGHMAAVGQSAALRRIFADVYAATTPRRVLVLGCTTGDDLALVDPCVTTTAFGVDVNGDYLARARPRLAPLGDTIHLLEANVLDVVLPTSSFDLVHAALLLEYVDAAALLAKVRGWLAPGGIASIVTQNASVGVPAVSATRFTSLRALDGRMTLHAPEELARVAHRAGLVRASLVHVPLPGGKSFSAATFTPAPPAGGEAR